MVWWLRLLPTLPKNQSLVSSTHVRQLTNVCYPSSRGSEVFGLCRHLPTCATRMHAHTHTNTHARTHKQTKRFDFALDPKYY